MVEPTMELLDWFRKQVEQADGDVLAEMLHIFAETLMDADAQSLCNAGFNEKSPDRTNTRNGTLVRYVSSAKTQQSGLTPLLRFSQAFRCRCSPRRSTTHSLLPAHR